MGTERHQKAQKTEIASRVIPWTLVLLMTSCASHETNLSDQGPRRSQPTATNAPAAAVPRPPRPGEEEILKEAEAAPSAPFEGEGWQPLLDGKSLAAWRET